MFDDVTKALTIQISADDLTGGAWSSIGKGAKDLMNLATPLNQAWELVTKVFETFAGAVQKPIEMLSEGGALAETEAAFRGLSSSFKVDGDAIVETLKTISSNTLGVEKAMQTASGAIAQGFSEDQIETISKFAKKFTEARGGEFTDIATKIFDAIATGKTKALKDFQLVADKGDSVAGVLEQIAKKTETFGKGAYNFGDDWEAVFTVLDDSLKQVYKEMNNAFGDTGGAELIVDLRTLLVDFGKEAPNIATGMFKPFYDVAAVVASTIGEVAGDLYLGLFEQNDNLSTVVHTFVSFVGNAIYDTSELVGNMINTVWFPFEKAIELPLRAMVKIMEAMSYVSGAKIPPELLDSLNSLSKGLGNSFFNTAELAREQEAFNKKLLETKPVIVDHNLASADWNKHNTKLAEGLKTVGQGLTEEKEKHTKATKAKKEHSEASKLLVEDTKALGDAYSKMGDGLGDTVKTIGDVLNLTQTGINEVAAIGAKAIAESDPFKFGEADKQRGIQSYLDKLRADKEKEREILKEQAAAQRELAKSMDKFATTPRKVEHNVSGGDPLSALATSIIKVLTDMALVEGTEVLGR